MHWAAKHIGTDYGAVGRCWGVVRLACRERFNEEMPGIDVGSDQDQAGAIKAAVLSLGWRRIVATRPEADDVVVMEGPLGRHVAWAVHADGFLGVLHARCSEFGVEFHRWLELPGLGFHSFEIWRRTR